MAIGSQPTFIVSTGRCGSTALDRALNKLPGVAVASELIASLDLFRPRRDARSEWLGQPSPVVGFLAEHSLYPAEMLLRPSADRPIDAAALLWTTIPSLVGADVDLALQKLQAIYAGPTDVELLTAGLEFARELVGFGTVLIERSGGSLAVVRQLISAFPDAQFIHLFRGGVPTALSMSVHPVFKLDALRRKVGLEYGLDPYCDVTDASEKVSLVERYGQVFPWDFGLATWSSDFPVPIDDFGKSWSLCQAGGLRALNELPTKQVLHISFDSLVDRPVAELERAVDFLRLGCDAADIRAAADGIGWRSTLAEPDPMLVRACALGERALRRLDLEVK